MLIATLVLIAAAAPPPAERPPEALALSRCLPIADAGARLACLDAAAKALDAAEADGSVVIVAGRRLQELTREAAVVRPSAPALTAGAFGREAMEAPTAAVRLTLARAHTTASGRWVMVAQDGSQWRQTDETQALRAGAGSTLVVERRRERLYCRLEGGTEFHCIRDR